VLGKNDGRNNLKRVIIKSKWLVTEEDEDDIGMNDRSINDIFKKKPHNIPAFNSHTRRFNYSADNNPGPGEYYDGMNP
jgi:hypothetical protein